MALRCPAALLLGGRLALGSGRSHKFLEPTSTTPNVLDQLCRPLDLQQHCGACHPERARDLLSSFCGLKLLVFTDIFFPNLGVGVDVIGHQRDALRRIKFDHAYAERGPQPIRVPPAKLRLSPHPPPACESRTAEPVHCNTSTAQALSPWSCHGSCAACRRCERHPSRRAGMDLHFAPGGCTGAPSSRPLASNIAAPTGSPPSARPLRASARAMASISAYMGSVFISRSDPTPNIT